MSIVLCLGLLGAAVLYVASWDWSVSGCRRLDDADAFLAYCDTPAFGSYEQEAYWFDLEPEAVGAMRRASVLFLGNSRLQFAFSTPQTDAFFAARRVGYHLLGFGYGENSWFARALLRRYRPTPRVVVINADPFFQDEPSAPAAEVRNDPWRGWVDGATKRLFDRSGPLLCRLPKLCSETVPTTYRDRRTGRWIWQDLLLPGGRVAGPITAAKAIGWSAAALPVWQRDAESFLSELGVARPCVLLTGVPNPAIDAEAMAKALGERLGLPVIQPVVPDLTSLDNSHLSAESAQRWSAAFLAAAAPRIEGCLPSE